MKCYYVKNKDDIIGHVFSDRYVFCCIKENIFRFQTFDACNMFIFNSPNDLYIQPCSCEVIGD